MYAGQREHIQNYDRKIRYLDYMENGARSRGAGFVKLERRDRLCSISLQISGLYRKDRFTRPLLLLRGDEEREIGRLQLANGGVRVCLEKLDSSDLDGNGLRYEQVSGIRIPVSDGKEIRCQWEVKAAEKAESDERINREMTGTSEGAAGKLESYAGTSREMDEASQGVAEDPERYAEGSARIAGKPESDAGIGREMDETSQEVEKKEESHEGTSREMNETSQGEAETTERPACPVRDSKWEQLWAIYPHIRPFQDEREYLSMGPGDFVILPGQYYKLVNNSFLLHGYYNYDHLIMTRLARKNHTKYYIGVPGNYYEREKKIAVMFGFESFECANEPAEEGDYGYYMIPVEL